MEGDEVQLSEMVLASVTALENLGRGADGGLDTLYGGDAGEKLAEFLRGLVLGRRRLPVCAARVAGCLDALIGPEVVKPALGSDSRGRRSGARWSPAAVARHAGGRRTERGCLAAQRGVRTASCRG